MVKFPQVLSPKRPKQSAHTLDIAFPTCHHTSGSMLTQRSSDPSPINSRPTKSNSSSLNHKFHLLPRILPLAQKTHAAYQLSRISENHELHLFQPPLLPLHLLDVDDERIFVCLYIINTQSSLVQSNIYIPEQKTSASPQTTIHLQSPSNLYPSGITPLAGLKSVPLKSGLFSQY